MTDADMTKSVHHTEPVENVVCIDEVLDNLWCCTGDTGFERG